MPIGKRANPLIKSRPLDLKSRRRPGRPSLAEVGEVDGRVLKSALIVFLRRGFEGATIEEISEAAGASKATIYRRFSGKETLFNAVVQRAVTSIILPDPSLMRDRSIKERLEVIAIGLIEAMLIQDVGSLARMIFAEAGRFPHLAVAVNQAGHERAVDIVASMLLDAATNGELPGLNFTDGNSVRLTAETYISLVFMPVFVRSLMGHDAKALRKELAPHVSHAVGFFLAGLGVCPEPSRLKP